MQLFASVTAAATDKRLSVADVQTKVYIAKVPNVYYLLMLLVRLDRELLAAVSKCFV